MKSNIRFPGLRTISTLIAIALAIPVSWNGLSGFYTWLSPYIMLNSVFALKSFVWLNIVSFGILLLVLFRKRWFCNHLCPVGWSCDKVSGISKRKTISYKNFPDVGKWIVIISLSAAITGLPLFIFLDPLAIFNGFFSSFSGKLNAVAILSLSGYPVLLLIHLWFPGIWCAKLCPLGGFQMIIAQTKVEVTRLVRQEKRESPVTNPGRRLFLMSGAGLLAGAAIPKIVKPVPDKILRPPAAVKSGLFNSLCCRCGNCSKTCPTGIIIPNTDFVNPLAWMTPMISFKDGYCLEDCNLCSQVCPTGSITLFSINAKSQLFMGTALVHLENCLLVNNKECVRCRESCKYDAIRFVEAENFLNMSPVVDVKRCVGCGACAVICPVNCIKIDPLF